MNCHLVNNTDLLEWTGLDSLEQLEKFLKKQNIPFVKTARDRIITTLAAIDSTFIKFEDDTDELIRWDEVYKLTGLNRTAIWRAEQRGEFPKRIQIGPRSVGWKKREIIAWQNNH